MLSTDWLRMQGRRLSSDTSTLGDTSMCSVMEESFSVTHTPDTIFPFPGDMSMCLTARTNVSNLSNSSGHCTSEGDQSVICHSAQPSSRFFNGKLLRCALDVSFGTDVNSMLYCVIRWDVLVQFGGISGYTS